MMLCELSSLSAKNQQTATDSRAVTDVFQYRRLLSYIEIGNIHTSVNISVNVSRKQFQNLESLQIYCTRSLTFQLGLCWFESYLVNQYRHPLQQNGNILVTLSYESMEKYAKREYDMSSELISKVYW